MGKEIPAGEGLKEEELQEACFSDNEAELENSGETLKAAAETVIDEEPEEPGVNEDASAESSSEKEASAEEEAEQISDAEFFRQRREAKQDVPDERDEKIAELTDRVQRQMAEFDNFRKRTEKEKAQMFDVGAKSIIERILPVIDNFERGLAALTEEEKQTAFADGMDKIYKQMTAALIDAGVAPIEAVGNEFDPNLHNAVMHVDDEQFGENTVAEEFQKGYLYHDQVVRHSMVKVAN